MWRMNLRRGSTTQLRLETRTKSLTVRYAFCSKIRHWISSLEKEEETQPTLDSDFPRRPLHTVGAGIGGSAERGGAGCEHALRRSCDPLHPQWKCGGNRRIDKFTTKKPADHTFEMGWPIRPRGWQNRRIHSKITSFLGALNDLNGTIRTIRYFPGRVSKMFIRDAPL